MDFNQSMKLVDMISEMTGVGAELGEDMEGQLVIYTGLQEKKDGLVYNMDTDEPVSW